MTARADLDELLQDLASGHDPLLQTLARMNTDALGQSDVDERATLLARFGALVAMDASAASYMVHLTLADQAGIGPAEIKTVLVSLAPLVGSARVVSAADRIMQAVQLAGRV